VRNNKTFPKDCLADSRAKQQSNPKTELLFCDGIKSTNKTEALFDSIIPSGAKTFKNTIPKNFALVCNHTIYSYTP